MSQGGIISIIASGGGTVTSVTGSNGVTASPTTGAVVVSGINATTSSVGVASFNPNDFTVSGAGQVSLIPKAVVIAVLVTGLTNATGNGSGLNPLIFDSAPVNVGAAYNTTTGIFTAPVTGNYMVSCNVMYNNLLPTHSYGEIIFNTPIGGDRNKIAFNPGLNSTSVTGYTNVFSANMSTLVSLLASQQFRINTTIYNGSKTVGIQGQTFGVETGLSIYQI